MSLGVRTILFVSDLDMYLLTMCILLKSVFLDDAMTHISTGA